MKYKVGDQVRIKSDIKTNCCWSDGALKYFGMVMTIVGIERDNSYWMKEDNGYWCWDDSMIEGIYINVDKTSSEQFEYKICPFLLQNSQTNPYCGGTMTSIYCQKNKCMGYCKKDDICLLLVK